MELLFLLGYTLLGGICPVSAILNNPLVYPPSGHQNGQQVVGILNGPDWTPSTGGASPWNYYFHRGCQSDNECYPAKTLLYCISGSCQCINGGATYINGVFYNYNMDWSDSSAQCISKAGSPCTLNQYWVSPETIRMQCVPSHDCLEITSSPAKALLAAQQQQSYQQRLQLQSYGYGGQNANPNHGQFRQREVSTGSSAATFTPSAWGICVRREPGSHEPVQSNNVNSGAELIVTGNASNRLSTSFLTLSTILISSCLSYLIIA